MSNEDNEKDALIRKYTKSFNVEQLKAFNCLAGDNNVFITGRAGTGKSYII